MKEPMDEAVREDRRRVFDLLYRLVDLDSFDDADWKQLLVLTTHPYQYFRIIAAELHARTGREESVRLLAVALFDRVELVAEEAASSLAKIGTDECVEYVRRALFEDLVDRPHYLTNALAHMGNADDGQGRRRSKAVVKPFAGKLMMRRISPAVFVAVLCSCSDELTRPSSSSAL
jgi:hypothetical protein